jgi:predicted flap endonuclease-1-like 5' DNA nuclease
MMGMILVLVGVTVGFILAWVFGAGSSLNLVYGLLLAIAGAIVGFVVEWLIDERVRKNRELQRQLDEQKITATATEAWPPGEPVHTTAYNPETLAEVLSQLKAMREAQVATPAESQNGPTHDNNSLVEVLRQYKDELHHLNQQIATKDVEMNLLRQTYDAYQRSHPDELTRIKGIGPVYQRKLRDVGVNSFKQLAEADPAHLRRLLDIKTWQRVNIEAWISQAHDLIQRV